ncbi:MAG: hypothetical protein J6Q39_07125 [Bacteroidales bacterium]|nr:hypothetical protein [Bacteroidales bacterium]
MRPFYEDSSAAVTLTKDRAIHWALRNFSEKPAFEYEVRRYFRDSEYEVLDRFHTKKEALVAKSFAEIEDPRWGISVVAVTPLWKYKEFLLNKYGG